MSARIHDLMGEVQFHARRSATYKGGQLPFKHNGHDREAAYPWVTDEEMAGMVRMLMRDDLHHEAVVCAARDRILHLSQTRQRLVLFAQMVGSCAPADEAAAAQLSKNIIECARKLLTETGLG